MDSTMQIFFLILSTLFLINIFLSGIVVFFERRNPSSTWAWLLVLFCIPMIGFLCYLVFGRDARHEKTFSKKMSEDQNLFYSQFLNQKNRRAILEQQKIKQPECITQYPNMDDLAYLHIHSGNIITSNNRVTCFTRGEEKFRSLIEDIRNAKTYIHMEYYIFRGDQLGTFLVEELSKKAKEGIEVKLIYDGMGCLNLPPSFFYLLADAGGEVTAFMPPQIVRLNYRDHRKLCIIDGKIGYIGGFNVGDEYLGRVKRYGPWRDTHLRLEGDAIDDLQFRFIADWNFFSKRKITLEPKYFPERKQFSGIKMQIVSSGPDTPWNNIHHGYFKMMTLAKHHIYLETPYFVPDASIFTALKTAALSGIDVRVIIPGHPDHFFVYWASTSYLGELLIAGVRCYRYEKGFIHSKATFIDGVLCSIGTANMDIRSFEYNCEVNAFLYDAKLTKRLEEDFLKDLQNCTEITLEHYQRRSSSVKIKEAVSRLISPIL